MFTVVIGGGPLAQRMFPMRCYRHLSSARRYARKIKASRHLGVETVWIMEG